ncbi:hypothetical protein QQ045_022455 [Rhodiola kirilowii]
MHGEVEPQNVEPQPVEIWPEDNDDWEEDNLIDMVNNVADEFVARPQALESLRNDSKLPLYEGCSKYTRLSATLKLFNLKAKNGWSDISFTELLTLVKDMLPEENTLPTCSDEAKKVMCPMGIQYKKIHACPNDCILYRNTYKDMDKCPVARARKLSLLSNYPHHGITYASYYVLALTKLRKYDEVLLEFLSLGDLDSSQYCYESYQEVYGERCGFKVPFSMRWIYAQIPIWLGQRKETLDRLYKLLDFVRTKLAEKELRDLNESAKMWRKRESFVISSIVGIHSSHKEFKMMLGDLEGAKKVFESVENLSDGNGFKF